MTKEITIKDIAKLANVSISTVSRVLNNLDRVNEDTRKKVMKVIEEMEYVPNNVAVSMVRKKTNMLVVMVPDLSNPFYTAVIQGAEEIAKSEGYFTFVFSTNDSKEEEEDFLKGILAKGVDGFISVSAFKDYEFYKNLSKPVVLVDRYDDECGLDGVIIDNFGGAQKATNYLVAKGHENIAIINGPEKFNIGKERFRGFSQTLSLKGISLKKEYIKRVSWSEEDGYRATQELLGLENPPSAIFASNNSLCMGAIKAIRDLGLTLGKEISLIGFDDNVLASFTVPNVTVINRPTYEMGVQAARTLIDKIKGTITSNSTSKVVLGTDLIERQSVKDVKQYKEV